MSDLETIAEAPQPSKDPNTYIRESMGLPPQVAADEAPKGDERPASKGDEEKPEPKPKAEKKEEKPSEEPSGELVKAREVITRKYKGVASKLLETLSEGEILAMSTQITSEQKSYADLANQRDREKAVQSTDRHEEEEQVEQGSEDAARPSETVEAVDLSEILGSLDADLYEGLPDVFTKVVAKVQADGDRRVQEAISKMETAFESRLESAQTDLVDAGVKREMAERFPTLQDPETSSKVMAEMKVLALGMEYPESADLRERREMLMERALVLVDPDAVLESKGKSTSSRGPTPPKTRGTASPPPVDPYEQRKLYMRLKSKGYSTERAKKEAGLS